MKRSILITVEHGEDKVIIACSFLNKISSKIRPIIEVIEITWLCY